MIKFVRAYGEGQGNRLSSCVVGTVEDRGQGTLKFVRRLDEEDKVL